MDKNNKRPRYLNLLKITLPVTGMVSIAHRVSGLLLVIILPFLIYAFQLSVSSAEGYAQLLNLLQQPWSKATMIVLAWGFGHHFFAGIRFLLIDVDVGVSRDAARLSAWLVHGLAVIVTLAVAGSIL